MALELNGTTGVSLVQDGVITTADIDDGAVTAGKLNSTLDLSGKTVTLPAGTGGKVLQVVSTTKTDAFSTTSTSYTAVGLSASITPSSTSNKILITVSCQTGSQNTSNYYGAWGLYRDGSTLLSDAIAGANVTSSIVTTQGALVYLDSPSSTSSITYAIYGKSEGNSSTFYFNSPPGMVGQETATITLMEIAG